MIVMLVVPQGRDKQSYDYMFAILIHKGRPTKSVPLLHLLSVSYLSIDCSRWSLCFE